MGDDGMNEVKRLNPPLLRLDGEGDVRFDAYPGRDLIGDVARFAAGGLGITVGSDHATLAVGGIILDADEPLPDMPRFDLVLIGGVA